MKNIWCLLDLAQGTTFSISSPHGMEPLYETLAFNNYHIVTIPLRNLLLLLDFELSKPRSQILNDNIHSSINSENENFRCAKEDFKMIASNLLSVASKLKL